VQDSSPLQQGLPEEGLELTQTALQGPSRSCCSSSSSSCKQQLLNYGMLSDLAGQHDLGHSGVLHVCDCCSCVRFVVLDNQM
jgi:hypothetical protein